MARITDFCYKLVINSMTATIHEILKNYWGYDAFRPLQEDIIQSVIDQKDTLALLPTGGGKSICFQVPAMAMDGICIVVSPLIALMKDQVANLKSKGIKAQAIVSGMNKREIDIALDNCAYGNYKFLYVSPERLKSELFLTRLQKMKVCMVAIDEAHCISQWGYDFRPPYLEINKLRELLKVPFLALTATATPKVVEDIQEKLDFPEKRVFQKSFERKNIHYIVIEEENKFGRLLKMLKKVEGTAIVYVRNRRKTKDIASFLIKNKITAGYYHAGLEIEEREAIQKDWIENRIRVICATNAFGMGIDKPDVRLVVNMDLPDSIEAYFQEAGRGGRDEKDAYGVLLVNETDRKKLTDSLETQFPDKEIIPRVYEALCISYNMAFGSGELVTYDLDLVHLSNMLELPLLTVYNALRLLEKAAYIELSENSLQQSTLKFTMNNMDLYDFQIRQPKFEPIIKLLLRSYGGLFEQFTRINEKELAKRAKSTIVIIRRLLQKLEELDVLQYNEHTIGPKVTFLQPRIQTKHVYLSKEVYEFRKKDAKARIDAVLNYAFSSDNCRSKLLLEYFGEINAPECGQCDVCLKKKAKKANPNDLLNAINMLLENSELTASELVQELYEKQEKDQILEMVRWLIDNKKVVLTSQNKLRLV